MMKIYRRNSDNFEVHDSQNRDLSWVESVYGEGFVVVDPGPTIDDLRAAKKALIEKERKSKENQGVIYNGIRYSGSQDTRVAMNEAVQFAHLAGISVFAEWKDDDGNYHPAHPVADVEAALYQVGLNRAALIGEEAGRMRVLIDATTAEGIEAA